MPICKSLGIYIHKTNKNIYENLELQTGITSIRITLFSFSTGPTHSKAFIRKLMKNGQRLAWRIAIWGFTIAVIKNMFGIDTCRVNQMVLCKKEAETSSSD